MPTCILTICHTVWGQYPQPDPLHLSAPPFNPVTVSRSISPLASFTYAVSQAPPEIPFPAPIASSSGPTRTVKSAKGRRRYTPIEAAERAAERKEGWDQTLTRFRDQLNDTLYSVHNGQPSGGLVPEMALARLDELIKDDLKRSVSVFFTALSFIISLIRQPGNSRSGRRRPQTEIAPGT